MAIKPLERVFVFEMNELPDPNPKLSETEVLDFYSNTYPELNIAYIDKSELDEETHQMKHYIKISVGSKA